MAKPFCGPGEPAARGPEVGGRGDALRREVGDDHRHADDDREDRECGLVHCCEIRGHRGTSVLVPDSVSGSSTIAPRLKRRSGAPVPDVPSAAAPRPLGERVELPVGLAQVHPAEHPGHDELAEREHIADGQAVGDELPAHEVGRVARQDDEAEVPGQEEERRRYHERLLALDQLTELGRSLDRLPVDVRAVLGTVGAVCKPLRHGQAPPPERATPGDVPGVREAYAPSCETRRRAG